MKTLYFRNLSGQHSLCSLGKESKPLALIKTKERVGHFNPYTKKLYVFVPSEQLPLLSKSNRFIKYHQEPWHIGENTGFGGSFIFIDQPDKHQLLMMRSGSEGFHTKLWDYRQMKSVRPPTTAITFPSGYFEKIPQEYQSFGYQLKLDPEKKRVFVTIDDQPRFLMVIDIESGKLLWKTDLPKFAQNEVFLRESIIDC